MAARETAAKGTWRGWGLEFETAGRRAAKPEVRTRIAATAHSLRCDWVLSTSRADKAEMGMLLRPGQRPVLYDRRSRRYARLAAPPRPAGDGWVAERTGRSRSSPCGIANEYFLVSAGHRGASRLSLWLLPGTEVGYCLGELWRFVLPPLTGPHLPPGVPLEVALGMDGEDAPTKRMRLTKWSVEAIGPDTLGLEPGFVEGFDGVSADPTKPSGGQAPPTAGPEPPTFPPLLSFTQQERQEKAKLLIRSTLLDQAVGVANFVGNLVGGVSGAGLKLDTQAIYDAIRTGAPSAAPTPMADRVAPNMVNRFMLWRLLDALKRLHGPAAMRQAVNDALAAAATGGDVTGVGAPPETPEDLAKTFDRVKKYMVALAPLPAPGGSSLKTPLAELIDLWAEGDEGQHTTTVQVLHLLEDMTPARQDAMEEWFRLNFGEVTLKPEPPLTQRNGRNEGWAADGTYYRDAIGQLFDLEFRIGATSLDLGGQPAIVDPLTPVTASNDVLIQALNLRDRLLGRQVRSRIGFRTTLHIADLSVSAHVSTSPTTRSYAVVQLALLCPPCLALLWQDAAGALSLRGVAVGLVLAVANDPLGLEDPRLEVYAGDPTIAEVDASTVVLNLLPILSPPVAAAFQELLALFDTFIAPSIVTSLTAGLSDSLPLPEAVRVRLQPLLNLNRESDQERLEQAISTGGDEILNAETAAQRLDQLKNLTPSGQNPVGFRSTFINYDVAIAITEPGSGGQLDYPAEAGVLSTPLALLLSHGVLQYWLAWAGAGVGYRGGIRLAVDETPELEDRPIVDFWNDAPEPQQLGPKPSYRMGAPQIALIPGSALPKWVGYHGIARVTSGIQRILPVSNPAHDDPIAELRVTVDLDVGVATYVPVEYQVCEDLTRVADWLDRGGFGPRIPPPRPGDPLPPWAAGLIDVHQDANLSNDIGPAIGPDLLDSLAAELGHQGPISSPMHGVGGLPRDDLGNTVACTLVTTWDKESSEQWLSARLTVTVPVLFGLGDTFPSQVRFLPGLTYRIDPARATVGELVAHTPAGPLPGLLQGKNRRWLAHLMANHALTLLHSDRTLYRLDHPHGSPLRYGYGLGFGVSTDLEPEGFSPRAIIALHPNHWSPDPKDNPIREQDPPPYITLETFGEDPERHHLAIHLETITNVPTAIMGA